MPTEDEFEERMRRFDDIGKAFATSYNQAAKQKPRDPLAAETAAMGQLDPAEQGGRPLTQQAAQGLEDTSVPIGPPGGGAGPPAPGASMAPPGGGGPQGEPPPMMTEDELDQIRRTGFGPF